MTSDPSPTIGEHDRASRERLTVLLAGASQADWARRVPACPGWEVHDVVAHLVAVVDDALAGRLTGPPSPEVTAEQSATCWRVRRPNRNRNTSNGVVRRWCSVPVPGCDRATSPSRSATIVASPLNSSIIRRPAVRTSAQSRAPGKPSAPRTSCSCAPTSNAAGQRPRFDSLFIFGPAAAPLVEEA